MPEGAAQQAGRHGEGANGAGRERVDGRGPEGAAGLEEILAQGFEIGQATEDAEDVLGALSAGVEGLGDGVGPGAVLIGAGSGSDQVAQLAAGPGCGGARLSSSLGLEAGKGVTVEVPEVAGAVLEGLCGLLEAVAMVGVGQAVPGRGEVLVEARHLALQTGAMGGGGLLQPRAFGELVPGAEGGVARLTEEEWLEFFRSALPQVRVQVAVRHLLALCPTCAPLAQRVYQEIETPIGGETPLERQARDIERDFRNAWETAIASMPANQTRG